MICNIKDPDPDLTGFDAMTPRGYSILFRNDTRSIDSLSATLADIIIGGGFEEYANTPPTKVDVENNGISEAESGTFNELDVDPLYILKRCARIAGTKSWSFSLPPSRQCSPNPYDPQAPLMDFITKNVRLSLGENILKLIL